jgi:hypothetical protein
MVAIVDIIYRTNVTSFSPGFVKYINASAAFENGMINTSSTSARFGADASDVVQAGERGRKSVHLTSTARYNENTLIVANIKHMPSSVGNLLDGCGVWPAYW